MSYAFLDIQDRSVHVRGNLLLWFIRGVFVFPSGTEYDACIPSGIHHRGGEAPLPL